MLLFEKIKWKNLLSTGNRFTEINFNEEKTNLIIGTNGAGKSTILDALTFVLFNKPFRKINKGQLLNSVNEKECVVEIDFSIGPTKWRIVRGIKPNIFEIYKDKNLLNQSSDAVEQQKWLEDAVLKLNYKSFTQIVILGSASFVPFMQLPTANRREIIEDLLDIKIFSSMNSIIKNKIKETSDKIKEAEFFESTIEDKISMQINFIEELENRSNANINSNKQKISKLNNEIDNYDVDNGTLGHNLKEHQKNLEDYVGAGDKLVKLNNLKGKISQKVDSITQEHKFFTQNTVCPTCTQSIEEEFRLNKITDVQNKAKDLQKGFEELEDTIKLEQERERQFTNLSKEIIKLNHEISQNNTRISLNQRQIRDLEYEIQTITKQLENRNTEHKKLKKLKKEKEENFIKKAKYKQNLQYLNFSHLLLKDGGVKAKIVKKYLPLMNQQINKYLQLMDFYINFTLDEEFKETIKSPIHEDFTYESFSEGEKMRIDLALLFTWREISRMKNSVNTNLLILDEVFDSSLDSFGTDYFTKIIRYIIKDSNVFVISHKTDELVDKFDKIIKFDKRKGFSVMVDF
jgi:DNA repair exonuclease SbcCD ATPase subunit